MKPELFESAELKLDIKLSIGKYIKNFFCKGPERIEVRSSGSKVYIQLTGVFVKAEKLAIEKSENLKEAELIKVYRETLLQAIWDQSNPIQGLFDIPIQSTNIECQPDQASITITLEFEPI